LHIVFPRWGGHRGPPLQLLLRFIKDRVVDGDVGHKLNPAGYENLRVLWFY